MKYLILSILSIITLTGCLNTLDRAKAEVWCSDRNSSLYEVDYTRFTTRFTCRNGSNILLQDIEDMVDERIEDFL